MDAEILPSDSGVFAELGGGSDLFDGGGLLAVFLFNTIPSSKCMICSAMMFHNPILRRNMMDLNDLWLHKKKFWGFPGFEHAQNSMHSESQSATFSISLGNDVFTS